MKIQGQSVFIGHMVLHISAFLGYCNFLNRHGHVKLRKLLKKKWFTSSERDSVIHAIHIYIYGHAVEEE